MPRKDPISDRSGRSAGRSRPESGQELGEVIFEFIAIGQTVKVSAVDLATGTEVSIMGPATESQHALERVALAKLRFVMNGKNGRSAR